MVGLVDFLSMIVLGMRSIIFSCVHFTQKNTHTDHTLCTGIQVADMPTVRLTVAFMEGSLPDSRTLATVEYHMRFVDAHTYKLDEVALVHLTQYMCMLTPSHVRFTVDAFDNVIPSIHLSSSDIFDIEPFISDLINYRNDSNVGLMMEIRTQRQDVFNVDSRRGTIASFEWSTHAHILQRILENAVSVV